jgi:hypothetical protein
MYPKYPVKPPVGRTGKEMQKRKIICNSWEY